jgi:hypothetical protein
MPITKTFKGAIDNKIKKSIIFTRSAFEKNPDAVHGILNSYLIYDVDHNIALDTITYYVYSKNGHSVEDGEMPPQVPYNHI